MMKLKLGVIGLSEGNGHPYSWSAIFNGYEPNFMKECPFSVIPEYLGKTSFPGDYLNDLAEVTAVWTEDVVQSESIAKAAMIPRIVLKMDDLFELDGVLLARDDAERHLEMALPFLERGIPVFVDKPLALNLNEVHRMQAACVEDYQLFSCSALRYAREFQNERLNPEIGEIRRVYASVPKKWETYIVHVVEPSFHLMDDWSEVVGMECSQSDRGVLCSIEKESGVTYNFESGISDQAIGIHVQGEFGNQEFYFEDSFFAFRESLRAFIDQIRSKEVQIPWYQTEQVVEVIEGGIK
jgi:hypothetical protein